MYSDDRPPMPKGARTLPGRYYTDPVFFGAELEQLFCSSWIHVGRTETLSEAGDYFTREIGRESVIVLRGDAGGLAAFHNVCRHRGTRLCGADSGRLPGVLQCAYHSWTYGLDGVLRNAPHMEKAEGFRIADYPLHSVAVDTWDGHVFVNLGDAPETLSDQLEDLPGKFAPWGMGSLRLGARRSYQVRANWKLVIQNYSECLHCPPAHPQLNRLSHYMSGENDPPRRGYLGGRMDLKPGVASLTLDGTTSRRPLPGLEEADRRRVYYYAILPNLLLNLHPDYMMTFTLWPRACDLTEIVCEWHFHPDEMTRPGFDPSDAVEFWDLTNRQDWELSDLAQRGISSRAYSPGPYSNREELLYALDRLVRDRIRPARSEPDGPANQS
jgi:Rieske 2Fe-2S family protein